MNKLFLFLIALVGVLTGCSLQMGKSQGTKGMDAATQGRTQVSLSAAPGTLVKGFYVQRGERYEFSNPVPWGLDSSGISYIEIRKVNANDAVDVNLDYDDRPRSHVKKMATLGPGAQWIKVQVQNGFATKIYTR